MSMLLANFVASSHYNEHNTDMTVLVYSKFKLCRPRLGLLIFMFKTALILYLNVAHPNTKLRLIFKSIGEQSK